MKRHWIFKGCLIFAVLLIISHQLTAKQPKKNETADWPRFRGPKGTGISQETDLLETWPDGGPNEIWRVPIGAGYSGITVAINDSLRWAAMRNQNFLSVWIQQTAKSSGVKKSGHSSRILMGMGRAQPQP